MHIKGNTRIRNGYLSVATLIFVAVVVIIFASCSGNVSQKTPSAIEGYEEYSKNPVTLTMDETPKETMWEFTYGANRYARVCIAELFQSGLNRVYTVDMTRKASNIGPEYRYFLVLTPTSGYQYEGELSFEVTKENIDEVWEKLLEAIEVYNNSAEQVAAGTLEYDEETWVSVYDSIGESLNEYIEP